MVSDCGVMGIAAGAGLAFHCLLAGGLLAVYRRLKRKEERRYATNQADAKTTPSVPRYMANQAQANAMLSNSNNEVKTVVVENRGSIGSTSGVAEVMTSGPSGTEVTTLPTSSSGAVVVSTASAGVPGQVIVEPQSTLVVRAEHPPGKPEEARIVATTKL